MDTKQAHGFAHGKVILMGEHAVVYGEPAIALPFPAVELTATIKPTRGALLIDCSYYQGIASMVPDVLKSMRVAIETALQSLNQPLANLRVTIESTIPPERGMGSSAAVAVAITKGIYNYFHQPLEPSKLLELVMISEKVAHGNPSGLDAITTSGDMPVFYRKGDPIIPFKLQMNAYLVVADTGITGQTKEAVESIARHMDGELGQTTREEIRRLGNLSKDARGFLEQNEPIKLGDAMTAAHHLLTDLGVSNEQLNRLVKEALEAGALGAKLTGGGRGGCMIALASSMEVAQQIATKLEAAGAVGTWITFLGQEIES